MSVENLIDQALALCSESTLKNTSFIYIRNLMKDEDSKKIVAKKINKQISDRNFELQGLELLNYCITRFSEQNYVEFGPYWVRHCLNSIKNDHLKEFNLRTISKIIVNFQHSGFRKVFLDDYLHATLQASLIRTADLNINEASLNCILSCLRVYAKSSVPFRMKIEEFILGFLNSSNDQLVEASGLAFSFYQEIGKCEENITLNLKKLCVTCHKYYNLILKNEKFIKDDALRNIPPFNLDAAPVFYDVDLKLNYEVQIIKNCVSWMMILLQKNAPKIIYPRELLDVIRRGIFPHLCSEQKELPVRIMSMQLHSMKIQIQNLKLLQVLILQMGSLLLPFYRKIMKIVFEIFDECKLRTCCYGDDNSVQGQVFNVLSTWLKYGGCGLDQELQEKIISYVIQSVFLPENSVSLKIDTNLVGKSSKKRNKYIRNKIATQETDFYSLYNEELKTTTAIYSLKILKCILDNTNLSIKTQLLKKLINSLMETLTSIERGKPAFPFNDEKCQILLYEVICSMYGQDSIELLPPIQIVLNAFKNGCSMNNLKIVETCSKCLNILEKICQPVCSSMYISHNVKTANTDVTSEETLEPNDVSERITQPIILDLDNEKPKINVLYDVKITETPVNVIKEKEVMKEFIEEEKEEHNRSMNVENVEENETDKDSETSFKENFEIYEQKDTPKVPVSPKEGLEQMDVDDDPKVELLESFLDIVNDDFE